LSDYSYEVPIAFLSMEVAVASPAAICVRLGLVCSITACGTPQVIPSSFALPARDADGNIIAAPKPAQPGSPPVSLEKSMELVHDTMGQYLWESVAIDGNANNLNTFLIGLTAYSLYKGVTHPSSGSIAGAAGVGSAAYAYGISNNPGLRAAAYTDGFRRLNCALGAALPYRIVSSADMEGNHGTDTLSDAIASQQAALSALENTMDGLSPYNTVEVKKPARAARSGCTWNNSRWRNEAARACREPARAADTEAPPRAVSAAINQALAQAEIMRSNLTQANALFAVSHSMGIRLWENANFIAANTMDAVRGTISDPKEAMARVKNFAAQQAAPTVAAALPPAQLSQSNRETRDTGKSRALTEYSEEGRQLAKLYIALRHARIKNQELQSILDQNHRPALSFERIDRCRSSADEIVQDIALSARNAPASAPAPAVPKDNQTTPIIDAPPALWQGLDFASQPALAALTSRIEQCQQHLGVPVNANRWESIGDVIRAGQCKGLAWK
jgi:hypothetical protein